MRKFDKTKGINKANILAEQRYLESKGFITENERTSMSEFFGDTTDNVDTLIKMFSKYQPTRGWLMTVGYVNNISSGYLPANIQPESIASFEEIANKLESPTLKRYVDSMMSDAEWARVKDKYSVDQERAAKGLKTKSPGKAAYANPYAAKTQTTKNPETGKSVTEITEPAKVYSTKSFTVQWENIRQKSDRDSELLAIRDKHGISGDEGSIPTDDWRGRGYENIPSTPFKKHERTGNKMIDFYSKGGVQSHKSKFFINFDGEIAELTPEEANFIFKNIEEKGPSMPNRLASMANQEAAQEIFNMEQMYQMKNFNLDKVSYIICSINIDGENKKFSYINRNAIPDGLKPGEFKDFIEASLPQSIGR